MKFLLRKRCLKNINGTRTCVATQLCKYRLRIFFMFEKLHQRAHKMLATLSSYVQPLMRTSHLNSSYFFSTHLCSEEYVQNVLDCEVQKVACVAAF